MAAAKRKNKKARPKSPRRAPEAEGNDFFANFFSRAGRFAEALLDGDDPLGGFVSVMGEPASALGQQLMEWAGHLVRHAPAKWGPSLLRKEPCSCPGQGRAGRCGATAVTRCDLCEQPCCLAHARIDYQGGAICGPCVRTAHEIKSRLGWTRTERAAPSPPGGMTVEQAYAVLGVKPGQRWAEIHAEYRRLVFELHPDKADAGDREKRTEQLKRVTMAYDVLKNHVGKKAA